MALTAKERERIVEEEKLRYETRQSLHREACSKHRPNRWLWWVVAAAVGYVAYCYFVCGGFSCPVPGMGAKSCHHGAMMHGAESGEPGQPLPPNQ